MSNVAVESREGGWETFPRNKQAGIKRECSALNRRLSIEHPRGEQCRYVFDLCGVDCLKSSVLLSGGLDSMDVRRGYGITFIRQSIVQDGAPTLLGMKWEEK